MPVNTGSVEDCSFKFSIMKVLTSLRKRTKSGVSTWTFCIDHEMKVCYAVGGEDLKVIKAVDRVHLRTIYNNFLNYGYTRKLPPLPVEKKELLVADPWESELPLHLQYELAELSA